MLNDHLAVLAGGFLGSAHCVGMCGGFAAAVGAGDRPFWPVFARQLVYNGGRVFTYAFLGVLAGAGGLYVSRWTVAGLTAPQMLSLLAGILMLCIGASALGLFGRARGGATTPGGLFAPLFSYFLNARGWAGYFAAGLANGFLPCGLVYSFVALAASRGTVVDGALLMSVFGLGTLPAMLAMGCGSTLLTHTARQRIYRLAAVLVIAMGCVTIWRGWPSGESCHDAGAAVSTCHAGNVDARGADGL